MKFFQKTCTWCNLWADQVQMSACCLTLLSQSMEWRLAITFKLLYIACVPETSQLCTVLSLLSPLFLGVWGGRRFHVSVNLVFKPKSSWWNQCCEWIDIPLLCYFLWADTFQWQVCCRFLSFSPSCQLGDMCLCWLWRSDSVQNWRPAAYSASVLRDRARAPKCCVLFSGI